MVHIYTKNIPVLYVLHDRETDWLGTSLSQPREERVKVYTHLHFTMANILPPKLFSFRFTQGAVTSYIDAHLRSNSLPNLFARNATSALSWILLCFKEGFHDHLFLLTHISASVFGLRGRRQTRPPRTPRHCLHQTRWELHTRAYYHANAQRLRLTYASGTLSLQSLVVESVELQFSFTISKSSFH
ncbi:hypothetical protein B0F90DRAFT_361066 [Multifurca ochricompacta]|uniref:Uncharacterized protein n=1 Tax=Multifurca ochricompacta TaxID=376703 RepID=A0AAD4QNS8_9AGAM|nr:hypothetical protein B0F90DRAFT_361066 [Multifurca ochricompacta]